MQPPTSATDSEWLVALWVARCGVQQCLLCCLHVPCGSTSEAKGKSEKGQTVVHGVLVLGERDRTKKKSWRKAATTHVRVQSRRSSSACRSPCGRRQHQRRGSIDQKKATVVYIFARVAEHTRSYFTLRRTERVFPLEPKKQSRFGVEVSVGLLFVRESPMQGNFANSVEAHNHSRPSGRS